MVVPRNYRAARAHLFLLRAWLSIALLGDGECWLLLAVLKRQEFLALVKVRLHALKANESITSLSWVVKDLPVNPVLTDNSVSGCLSR